MQNRRTKKVVVIKDIPSNIIEEAILILRGDPNQVALMDSNGVTGKSRRKDNEFLVKEAESIIKRYIRENEVPNVKSKDFTLKQIPQNKFMVNIIINLALVGSVAFFIFLITKAF